MRRMVIRKMRRAVILLTGLVLVLTLMSTCLMIVNATSTEPVNYLDASGAAQTCTAYTSVAESDTVWQDGWYVASGVMSVDSRVQVSGDVHLVLADACELSTKGIDVPQGSSFTIYAQSVSNAGILIADARGANGAGIGSSNSQSSGAITINGGKITAYAGTASDNGYGKAGSAGIGSDGGADHQRASAGSIVINGGNIKAYGSTEMRGAGAGIGGGGASSAATSITISGGTVYAQAGEKGAAAIGGGGNGGVLSNVSISNCNVTAKGSPCAVGGGIEESPASADSFSNCWIVDLTNNKITVYGDKNNGGKITLEEDYVVDAGKTLDIPIGTTLIVPEGKTLTVNGTIVHNGSFVNKGVFAGNGTVQHVYNTGTSLDAQYHTAVCGCGYTHPDPQIHSFDNFRDNEDGTHTEYCKVCLYEKTAAVHTYQTTVENADTFKQTCSACGNVRTSTLSDISLSYTDDLQCRLSASVSSAIQGATYQWQKQQSLR